MTSLHVICDLGPPPHQKSWLRLCLLVTRLYNYKGLIWRFCRFTRAMFPTLHELWLRGYFAKTSSHQLRLLLEKLVSKAQNICNKV